MPDENSLNDETEPRATEAPSCASTSVTATVQTAIKAMNAVIEKDLRDESRFCSIL